MLAAAAYSLSFDANFPPMFFNPKSEMKEQNNNSKRQRQPSTTMKRNEMKQKKNYNETEEKISNGFSY